MNMPISLLHFQALGIHRKTNNRLHKMKYCQLKKRQKLRRKLLQSDEYKSHINSCSKLSLSLA